jgi:hypothetical protein
MRTSQTIPICNILLITSTTPTEISRTADNTHRHRDIHPVKCLRLHSCLTGLDIQGLPLAVVAMVVNGEALRIQIQFKGMHMAWSKPASGTHEPDPNHVLERDKSLIIVTSSDRGDELIAHRHVKFTPATLPSSPSLSPFSC